MTRQCKQCKYGLWLTLLAIPLISACGIKPGSLQPPEGSEPSEFPRNYPMPEGE